MHSAASHPNSCSVAYLVGPTASGKTAIGVELAGLLVAEVIALDSMTLYRQMNIGTAKPTAAERRGVAHHLIDVLDPWESASVADYRRLALAAQEEIHARHKTALYVGGTPLYLKVMLRGLFEGPGSDSNLRAQLEAQADQSGLAALHKRLETLDLTSASRIHPNDRRRIIRALEVITLTGQPLSDQQKEHAHQATSARVLWLDRPRETLYQRIDERTRAMFEGGLLDEVRQLLENEQPLHAVPAQAAGYREAIDCLTGRLTLTQAIEATATRTRQLAKRQLTWFRNLAEAQPLPVPDDEPPEATARRIAQIWSEDPLTPPAARLN